LAVNKWNCASGKNGGIKDETIEEVLEIARPDNLASGECEGIPKGSARLAAADAQGLGV
jgi:hypothetical protein